ncbi:DNA replication/repair protein RecF [Mobiluncus curtisii]|uniref:DNA replication and repair protein RecF n=2 Tax=Mobiluncus curtisii TaxID=2051 RepID=D6ZJV7_MOBCV|nr:DNA replication/repair protein RecF [Mobiluncus curtisii]ADI67006.1 DNA replication and repair protein RecF [Mobiluncus curtisii ATCC 43063]NMW89785.1 DNA replication/repair protein RecF [Mobiluncus curtisii]QQU09205.1 DNA replication/repair protein RecF [Mobiluncus curtisii]SQB63243.1 DNA replication and repair protein recF [Mobiluncus curtisii]
MFVSDLALDWFRSYRQVILHFPAGTNVFVGANGQGKTNLLEALNYLAVLASHRIGTDAGLIFREIGDTVRSPATLRAGVIRARVHPGTDLTDPDASGELLEIELLAGRANRAMINRHNVRPRSLLGHLSTVLFAPEDLQLVQGDPATRRTFLDRIAIQLRPTLVGALGEYTKIARQRGAYLKDVAKRRAPIDEIQLSIWDDALVPAAVEVMRERARVIDQLAQFLPSVYARIAGHPAPVGLTYADSVTKTLELSADEQREMYANPELLSSVFRQALAQCHADEARRGVNLVGPHRDELELHLNGLPVKGFASHGESWSYALSLRLAEFSLLRENFADTPVLLLDDVFAELDEQRRAALLWAIDQADQVFITSATGTEIPEALHAAFYRVTLDPETRESSVETLGQGAAPDFLQ